MFNISDVESHELYIEDPSSDNCLPMFGAICCRLAALPYCSEDPVMTGLLFIQKIRGSQTVQDFREEKRCFGSLMDWKLSLWHSKEQKDSARKAMISIPISRDSCVLEENETSITITNDVNTWKLVFMDENTEFMVRYCKPYQNAYLHDLHQFYTI